MANNRLVMIGGGGHCKSVLDIALQTNEFSEIVITDPSLSLGMEFYGCKVVGNDDVLSSLKEQGFEYAFITVGSIDNTSLRRKLVKKAANLGFRFPVITDPSAVVSKHALIGGGTFIGKNTVINAGAVIGCHCILNTGSIIEHECYVGDFSHVSVGVVLCGDVRIEEDAFIGAGTIVKQKINIGSHSLIGAGSVVLKDIPPCVKAYGHPCRVIQV